MQDHIHCARSVLNIDEVVDHICCFAEHSVLAHLLTVSRSFFFCAAPRVWSVLPGIAPILSLLPAPSTHDFDLEGNGGLGNSIKFKPTDQHRLHRFFLYAPFIRTIICFPNGGSAAWYWEVLVSRVAARPLFPNLRHLLLDSLLYRLNEINQDIASIEVLLEPQLVSFRLPQSGMLWMSPHDAGKITPSVARTCRNIQYFRVTVGGPWDASHMGTMLAPLAHFYNLRTLEMNHAILHSQVLYLLGTLPQLESIVIISGCNAMPGLVLEKMHADALFTDDLALPASSFPALRYLAVFEATPRQINRLWRASPLSDN